MRELVELWHDAAVDVCLWPQQRRVYQGQLDSPSGRRHRSIVSALDRLVRGSEDPASSSRPVIDHGKAHDEYTLYCVERRRELRRLEHDLSRPNYRPRQQAKADQRRLEEVRRELAELPEL